MSNFRAMTKAKDPLKYPMHKNWKPANWLDDYFGHHVYGIQFDGGQIYRDNDDFIYSPDMKIPDTTTSVTDLPLDSPEASTKAGQGAQSSQTGSSSTDVWQTINPLLDVYSKGYSNRDYDLMSEARTALLQLITREKETAATEARIDENMRHKENSAAAFHAIPEPTDEQRRIHEGLTMKFDARIKSLQASRPVKEES